MIKTLKIRKPNDLGLAVRRFFVFALPAFVLLFFIIVNVAMGAFQAKPEEKEEVFKATPVVVAEALSENAKISVTAQGEVRPRKDINLSAEISGKIVYVSPQFIEGGAFEEGDVLVRIDPDQFRFRVTQAKSNVAQARSLYASEEAEMRIARKDWEELGEGEGSALALREPQMAQAAAELAAAEAMLDEAELQLERATIRAPFKGRVRSKMVDIGDYATPGMNFGEVFSTDVMQVALPLTDAELGQLGLNVGFREGDERPGPAAVLSALVAGEPRVWNGRLVRTDSGYDRQTRVLFAYVEVEDPYGVGADEGAPLADGLFVTVKVEGREVDNAVVVPRSALRGTQEVYVATAQNTLEIRSVSVANSSRSGVVLTGGIEPGEQVITSPVRGAAEGMEIAIAGASDDALTAVADAAN